MCLSIGLMVGNAMAATTISKDVPVTGLSGAQSSQTVFQIQIPAGATNLSINTSGGLGNANLYAAINKVPTGATTDLKSLSLSNTDSINVAAPQAATYFILVHGYQAYSGLSLKVSYVPSVSWIKCAAEYGTCSFSGTRRVLYGASTTASNVIKNFTTSVVCNNQNFGDPAFGINKSCWYESVTVTTPPPTASWIQCATESGTCNFTSTRRVLYGASLTTSNVIKTFTASVGCNNQNFGDPASGINKTCWYESTTTTTPPPVVTGSCSTMPVFNSSVLKASGNLWIDRQDNVVIDGLAFNYEGKQNCLYITNSKNVTIRNSSFKNCYRGVIVEGSSNVIMENNYFENNVMGASALSSSDVKIRYNRIKNTGGGQWLGMTTAFNQGINGNVISFNKVTGTANEITCNVANNEDGKSSTEDLVTTYQSQGTAAGPILIQGNCLKGGGPSQSGGGIMVGDQGGKYITAQNNTLINVGQYSIAIAGGHYNKLLNNKVYARERAGYAYLDIGLYVNDYGNSLDGTGCSDNTVQGNQIDCIHGGTNCGAATNNSCGPIAGWSQNTWGVVGSRDASGAGPNLSGLSCPIDF